MHGPGVPANEPHFPSDAFDRVDQQAAALLAGTPAADLDTAGWTPHQWVHFLRALPPDAPRTRSWPTSTATFGFSGHGNIEIATAWLEQAIALGYLWSAPGVDEAMAGDSSPGTGARCSSARLRASWARRPRGLERAREIFATAGPGYHSVSRAAVDRILDAT